MGHQNQNSNATGPAHHAHQPGERGRLPLHELRRAQGRHERRRGTNQNGISNSGNSVGFTIDNDGNFHNFTVNPFRSHTVQLLNINGSTTAHGLRDQLRRHGGRHRRQRQLLHPEPRQGEDLHPQRRHVGSTAFGINDNGTIVGQYVTANATPGFIRVNGKIVHHDQCPVRARTSSTPRASTTRAWSSGSTSAWTPRSTASSPARSAAQERHRSPATRSPTRPSRTCPGEPGATFVFSQVLGINDKGIAVGYYGDSTTSQHGFLYNTHTGQYTFLDDPSEAFTNGVEVTQITGITNSGEITGFYSDANGVFHGFVASTH